MCSRSLALILLSCLPLASFPAQETSRPNIVFFLVDDLGWQDVSVPFHEEVTPFNRRYRTPNVARLASWGMKFTHAYASAPVCTPTRTSIMTGMCPGRSKITYWTLYKDRDQSANHPVLRAPAWNVNALKEGDVTLPSLLKQAGYRTIHVGKAHLGARETSGADPRRLGFDVNIGGHAAGGPGSYYGTENFSAVGRKGSAVWDIPGLEKYHGKNIYLTEALTAEALPQVAAAIDLKVPFFLHFAPYAVHAPLMPHRSLLASYDSLDAKEAAYATMVESFDIALGAVIDLIIKKGVADNTLIVFTSDNGGLSAHARGGAGPHTHNAPLRSGKGSGYEGGIRIPTIVTWPGVVRPGTTCTTPIVSHDFFATLTAAASVSIPEAHRPKVDGADLRPLLSQQTTTLARPSPIVFHQPHFWGVSGPGIEPFTAIRDGDLKLLYFHADRRFELYDVVHDVSESNDLAQERPADVKRLAKTLDHWFQETAADLSIDKATGQPVESPGTIAERL